MILGLGWILMTNADVQPLVHAHAHNDYAQKRPLESALELGFCSIEVDVFPVNGQLLVAHDEKDLDPKREFVSMYLKPLVENARSQSGWVYRPNQSIQLLVDIKKEGRSAYEALQKAIEPYQDSLTEYRDTPQNPHQVVHRAITIVLSGDRPMDTVATQPHRFAFIDGRLSDLGKPAYLFPLVSESFLGKTKYSGRGALSEEDAAKISAWTQKAHQAGQTFRFWATPETEACWRELLKVGVDWIGTDQQPTLAQYLRKQ